MFKARPPSCPCFTLTYVDYCVKLAGTYKQRLFKFLFMPKITNVGYLSYLAPFWILHDDWVASSLYTSSKPNLCHQALWEPCILFYKGTFMLYRILQGLVQWSYSCCLSLVHLNQSINMMSKMIIPKISDQSTMMTPKAGPLQTTCCLPLFHNKTVTYLLLKSDT